MEQMRNKKLKRIIIINVKDIRKKPESSCRWRCSDEFSVKQKDISFRKRS